MRRRCRQVLLDIVALLSIVAEELASVFIGALAAYSPSFPSATATRSAAAALRHVVRGESVLASACLCRHARPSSTLH